MLSAIKSRDQLPSLIAGLNPNAVVVELGVYRGDYLAKFAERLIGGHCYGVDSWLDHLQGRERTEPTPKSAEAERLAFNRFHSIKNVTLIKSDTLEAANRFADNSLDFVYVDADHTVSGCSADIATWYPKVKSGSIMAGHDYMKHSNHRVTFGVIEAVQGFFNPKDIKVYITKDYPPSWIVQKP